MTEKKSLVEEALLQMKNLEQVVAENAKGILASTMKEEISELVKESLKNEAEDESMDVEMDEQSEDDLDMDIDMDSDDEEMDDVEMDIDMDSDDDESDDELEMDFDMDSNDTPIDLTDASDEEILKVFKAMGEDDGIIVKKDGENVHLTDNDADVEYLVKLGESEDEMMSDDEDDMMSDDEDDMMSDYEDEDDVIRIPYDMPAYKTKWRERNWELRIYGAGNDRALLEQLISEKGLSNKIFLMGHTNDTAAAYRNTHLLLQITHIDSMPLSVTEALSMGRPCVVSRVGDMPVWIADGQNGYLADEVTVNGIDQVLERAWADRAHWESLGKRAYAGFVQKYPQHYEAFYEALFSGHLSP